MSAPNFVVTLNSQLTIVETPQGPDSPSGSITISGFNETVQLTQATTPAVTKGTAFQQALTAGTATIDLTALPGLTPDEVVNGNGLKVQFVKFQNPSANANKIVVAKGASNGVQLDGATTWSFPLAPGQSILVNCDNLSDTIGSTKKTIDLTGTGSQVLNVEICMG